MAASVSQCDVLVIGAGAAGLSCARALTREGLATVVLEARERVGGRISTLRLPGLPPIELGAQVVHGDRAATWNIIREAGVATARLSARNEMVFSIQGRVWSLLDVQRARVPLPWSVEQRLIRIEVPDRAVASLLQSADDGGIGRTLALEWISQTWCADPAELSAAGMKRIRDASLSGDGEFKIVEGYDTIPRLLGRGLEVRLGRPVREVHWRASLVRAVTDDETVEARAAVVTVPAPVIAAGGIRFEPALPREKRQAARSIGTGDALVVVCRLAHPSPQSLSALVAGEGGGIWVADAGSPIVRGWIHGPAARRIGGHPVTVEKVASLVGHVFDWIRPDSIREVHSADWSADPFALGGYSFPKAGSLEAPAKWAAPVDETLFFAGEATCATRHAGLVHGAIESGVRAAREVLARVGEHSPRREAFTAAAPRQGHDE